MLRIKDPMEDIQQMRPCGQCRICLRELYHYDPWPLCRECEEEQYDPV